MSYKSQLSKNDVKLIDTLLNYTIGIILCNRINIHLLFNVNQTLSVLKLKIPEWACYLQMLQLLNIYKVNHVYRNNT